MNDTVEYLTTDEWGDPVLIGKPETARLVANFLNNEIEHRACRVYGILNTIAHDNSKQKGYKNYFSYDKFVIESDSVCLYGSNYDRDKNEYWVSFDDFFNDEYHVKAEADNIEKMKAEAEKERLVKLAVEKKAVAQKEKHDREEYERLKAKFSIQS